MHTLEVDGSPMDVFVAAPAQRGPGILVFQEAYGVNGHIRVVAQRFAKLGYVAAAPELFHRTARGFQAPYSDFPAVRPHLNALTAEGIEADVRATYDLVRNHPLCDGRVVSVGFCMGGRASFLANAAVPLAAAVSFYGGGIAPGLLDRAKRQHGPIVFIWGGLDKHIGEEQRSAIRIAMDAETKPYLDVLISFADHGFFCDERASYSAEAARDAWALTTSFLAGNLSLSS